jgi:threonine/homoserine/homoserine lactone efflux protein
MYLSQAAADLLLGVLIGLSIAVPIGPSCILCIQRCLAGGMSAGLATGLGISTVHAVYATLALRGSAEIAGFVGDNADAFKLCSVCLLFIFAVRALKSVPRIGEGGSSPSAGEKRARLGRYFVSAVLLGAMNPMTVLFFVAVIPSFTGVLKQPPGAGSITSLVIGVTVGSFGWWSTVVLTVRMASRSLLDDRRIQAVNRASAFSLALVGLAFLLPVLKSWVIALPPVAAVTIPAGLTKGEGSMFGLRDNAFRISFSTVDPRTGARGRLFRTDARRARP